MIALEQYLKEIFLTDLRGVIFATNAFYGTKIGLHDDKLIKDAIKEAYDRAVIEYPDPQSPSCFEFIRFIEDACKEAKSSASRLAGQSRFGSGCGCDGELFVVLPAQIVMWMASAADFIRFQDNTGTKPTLNPINWMYELDEADRYFTFEHGKSLGDPWLWFTQESKMPKFDAAVLNASYSASDYYRDLLGLIHREAAHPGSPENHLCLFRFPKSLATRRPHYRPTSIEAGRHMRFCAKANDAKTSNSDPFGRALDLRPLADRASLEDGAGERVIRPIRSTDFEVHEKVWFQPLGPIKLTRGKSVNDDNFNFVHLLLRPQTVDELLPVLC